MQSRKSLRENQNLNKLDQSQYVKMMHQATNDPSMEQQAVQLIVLASACTNSKQNTNNEKIELLPYVERYTYLTDSNEIKWVTGNIADLWWPTYTQRRMLENLAVAHIAVNAASTHQRLRKEPFERYYRQYVCYINTAGDSIMYINAGCYMWTYDLPKLIIDSSYLRMLERWRSDLSIADDGGDCHWQMNINYSKKQVEQFKVNNTL